MSLSNWHYRYDPLFYVLTFIINENNSCASKTGELITYVVF